LRRRQRDPDSGAVAAAHNARAAAVRLGNRPNDGEPEPGASAPTGAVGPREPFEGALAEAVGEAGPVVSDVEPKLAVRAARLEADLCASVAERVVHHVRQRLLQPQPVAA